MDVLLKKTKLCKLFLQVCFRLRELLRTAHWPTLLKFVLKYSEEIVDFGMNIFIYLFSGCWSPCSKSRTSVVLIASVSDIVNFDEDIGFSINSILPNTYI